MKKILCSLLIITMLLTVAVGAIQGEEMIKTDKTEYYYGEDIFVTAKGEGKDWVGLYLTDEVPGTAIPSIYWYYIAQDGNVSGETKSISESEHTNEGRSYYFDIPVGEYSLFLCADDGYEVISSVDIKVIEDPNAEKPINAPSSAEYKRKTDKPGYAEGTVKITAPKDGQSPDSYIIYWGDSNGKLAGFDNFAPVNASAATLDIPENTIIPVSATCLLIYSSYKDKLSESCFTVRLPNEAAVESFGKVQYEFQVMSDVHITSDANHLYNKHFANALSDIMNVSPSSVGIFIAGDLTDSGQPEQYKQYKSILKEAGDKAPAIYPIPGNHDYGFDGVAYETYLKRFMTQTGIESETGYYDKWINGAHFIFLSGEASGLEAQLSQKQLTWLKEKLDEKRNENAPVYIFLHQSIYNTVAGGFPGQGWDGVADDKALSEVLKDYPEAIMFNGHSHWELNSPGTMKVSDDKLPTIFSTASCGYLWNDECAKTNVGLQGSEGYYITAYSDKVLVLGRDFENHLWLPSAMFVVEYEQPDNSTDTTSQPQTEPTEITTQNNTEANDTKVTEIPVDNQNSSALKWIIPAVIVAAVVIGAVIGIVNAKKKK